MYTFYSLQIHRTIKYMGNKTNISDGVTYIEYISIYER